MRVLAFQANDRAKERKRRKKFSCSIKGRSFDLVSWVEVVYPKVNYSYSSSVWFGGLQCLDRTRCQVKPSLAARCVPYTQCLPVLQQRRWLRVRGNVPSNGGKGKVLWWWCLQNIQSTVFRQWPTNRILWIGIWKASLTCWYSLAEDIKYL